MARRSRRVFSTLPALRWLGTRGVRVERGGTGAPSGEWLTTGSGPGTILYLHGGGYLSCSPVTHRPITAGLARLSGLRVFSLDYRLAPEHRYPAALDDAFAAYRWLLERLRLPAGSIALAGDSAGGGLALGMLLRARDAGIALPACAVCFSPWTDLAGTGDISHAPARRCAMFHAGNLSEFASAYLGDTSPRDAYASPMYADLAGLPPVLLQVGSTELLLDDARRVHEKITLAGGASTLDVFDGVFHCWQMLDGVVPESRVALTRAAAFLREHVARP